MTKRNNVATTKKQIGPLFLFDQKERQRSPLKKQQLPLGTLF